MEFPRARRDGETREEYACALHTFERRCLSSEFPEVSRLPEPAGSPFLIAAPLTHTMSTRYKKTGGAADGAGESYEWKMLTLVFLRMLKAGHEFQLASNVEAAGLFDDIVARYRRDSKDPWRVACLQLKHKQKKHIQKLALLGISGDFSLVKYCASYAAVKSKVVGELQTVKHQQFIIFTNAAIDDCLVNALESDRLLSTGGKVVSFKPGGEIFRGLCDWSDFKKTLVELNGQVAGRSGDEVGSRVKDALNSVEYQNKAVTSWKDELLKEPTVAKLGDMLKKLEVVCDTNTCSSFLGELQVYTNQVHESELDAEIKKELAEIWTCASGLEDAVMFHELQGRIKSWWQRDNFYLTRDSILWREVVKSQAMALSKSTLDGLTEKSVAFGDSCLQVLCHAISRGGIVNVRVDSRTAASSLKVCQALAKFGARDLIVLRVNVSALLAREEDVLAAWATRWCPVLVVECNAELERRHAARIGARVLGIVGRNVGDKLLVLIASEKQELNVQLQHAKCYKRLNDNFDWCDLTEKSKDTILTTNVVINNSRSPITLSEMLGGDESFANKVDLEVLSQLLEDEFFCGKDLEDVGKFFVTRRLKLSDGGVPFVVNSVHDVVGRVVLVVAEPGMGKSTLMTHLAKSTKAEDPSAWIVHIKLNDCAQYLKEIDAEYCNEVAAKKFLAQSALSPGNCLENLLFGCLERNLVVFVDGVDEVCPHYEREVFALLSSLRDMDLAQLWVASRPVFQTKLEDALGIKTLDLVAFSESDQREFFNNVWLEKVPSMSLCKCNELTESFWVWLTDSLGKDNPIMGVPLMTAVIAETFRELAVAGNLTNGKFTRNETLDVLKLYQTFVRKKFDLYCVEKKKTPSRELAANRSDEETLLQRMHDNHRLAALRALFSRKEISDLQFGGKEKFDENLAAYLKDVVDGREKMGMIDNVVDGIPHFVHRSFAEYFGASWLALHHQANRELSARILFDPAYKLLGGIFHRLLAENHPLHVAVLNRDVEAAASVLSAQSPPSDVNELDAGGRTPLHLAVILSAADSHADSIRVVELLAREHNARLDVADEVLGWEPRQYAERSGAWTALRVLLENADVQAGRPRSFQKQNGWPKPEPRSMLDAARNASVLVVRYLAEERGGKLNCRGPLDETMFHMAAEGGSVETLKYLYNKSKSVRYLLERGLDLESADKNGLTALQVAAQRGSYDAVAVLLELKASFKVSLSSKVSNAQLNACLLCAAFEGSLQSVQKLVAMGASRIHRDDNDHSAAWVAMNWKHPEVVDWLLLRGSKDGDAPLHGACRKGEPDVVAFILARGADIDATGWQDQTPLLAATYEGQLAVVKLLLERGAAVESRDRDGWTPLYTAVSQSHGRVAVLLLSHGADVHARTNTGQTPLHAAVLKHRLDLVQLLLEHGADPECRDGDGRTPLHSVLWWGDEQLVALLLRHGADDESQSPLQTKALGIRLETAELLLTKGASVECSDAQGWTPLYRASWRGDEQVAGLMLRHGADLHAVNNLGMTPLHAAAFKNNFAVVELLLKSGASVQSRDERGWTPLHWASGLEVAALLLRHGADVRAQDRRGWTPLHAAAWKHRRDLVDLFLRRDDRQPWQDGGQSSGGSGATFTRLMAAAARGDLSAVTNLLDDFSAECGSALNYINTVDQVGWSAIYFAACLGQADTIRLLTSQGGDPLGRDGRCRTPMHWAAEVKQPPALKALLEAVCEADLVAAVNVRDVDGSTALHCAATAGCVDCAELLVAAGGKLTLVDRHQSTPLMSATRSGRVAVVSRVLAAFDAEKEGMSKSDYVNMRDRAGNTALDLASTDCREVLTRASLARRLLL